MRSCLFSEDLKLMASLPCTAPIRVLIPFSAPSVPKLPSSLLAAGTYGGIHEEGTRLGLSISQTSALHRHQCHAPGYRLPQQALDSFY